MGMFDEFVEDIKTELQQKYGPRVVILSDQNINDRKTLIAADRERVRAAELNKPFALEGAL